MSEILTFPPRKPQHPPIADQAAAKCLQIERMAYAISALADTPSTKLKANAIARLAGALAGEFVGPTGGDAA